MFPFHNIVGWLMNDLVWRDLCEFCTRLFQEEEVPEIVEGKKLHGRCVALLQKYHWQFIENENKKEEERGNGNEPLVVLARK